MPEDFGAPGPAVISALGPSLFTNFDGEIVEASPGACSFTGFAREELLFRSLEDFFPDLRTRELFPALKLMPAGAELRWRADLRRQSGSLRPVRLKVLLDPARAEVHVRLGHERRAEDRLLEESEFGRAILETCEGPVIVFNGQDRIVLASRACEEQLGIRFTELRGRTPWTFFVSQEESEGARRALAGLRSEGTPTREVWTWRSTGGEVRRIAWRLSRFQAPPGGRVFILASGWDLTAPERVIREHREAREDARSAFDRVRKVLDSVPALISYIDLERKYVFANRRYEEWFGVPVSRMEGFRVKEVLPPPIFEVIAPHLERAFAGERVSFQSEIAFPEGSPPRWMHVTYSPDLDPENRVVGVFAQVNDATEFRKRVDDLLKRQADLLQAILERDRAHTGIRTLNESLEKRVQERTSELAMALGDLRAFVHGMAHDLRGPLRAMAGFARAIREDYERRPIDALGAEYTTRIEVAAGRMDALVQGLLDFGRIAAGPMETRPVSLDDVIRRALTTLASDLAGRPSRVEVSGNLPDVRADAGILELVVVHLLSNALKFVPPGVEPHVRVRAEARAGGVRLLVEDNGIGIDEGYRDRVFGLFEQLHPPETYPGTGIGLAIVKKAMDRMGGRVDFKSAPGKGSTFWIDLHCAEAAHF